jgi:hypothetical protein
MVATMVTTLKRLFWLALLGGAGFAVWSMVQRRNEGADAAPPEWPPIDTGDASSPSSAAPADDVVTDDAADADVPTAEGESARWVEPVDGACPVSHPVKANDNSGIYHVPGGRFYERTGAERCYAHAEDAEADGYRAAKS